MNYLNIVLVINDVNYTPDQPAMIDIIAFDSGKVKVKPPKWSPMSWTVN